MCCLSLCVLVPGGLKCMCPGLKFRPRLLLPNISEIPCFSVILQRFYFFFKLSRALKSRMSEALNQTLQSSHVTRRLCTRTMERTITVRPAPYCFRARVWSQCCIRLLATLEWGQQRDRWRQMESQKCPSRYKDLATRNFLLGDLGIEAA